MFQQMTYYATLLGGKVADPDFNKLANPIVKVVNLGLKILITILVGITAIRLLLASIAMATAVGDEKMQKKDDLAKAVKGFGITAAVTAAVLAGGDTLTDWIMNMVKDPTSSSLLANGSALVNLVAGVL